MGRKKRYCGHCGLSEPMKGLPSNHVYCTARCSIYAEKWKAKERNRNRAGIYTVALQHGLDTPAKLSSVIVAAKAAGLLKKRK